MPRFFSAVLLLCLTFNAQAADSYITRLLNKPVPGGVAVVDLGNPAQAPKVLADPDDYDAWSELMWAGTIAHNNLLNTGRVGDWASHDIEHEISGIYDVAHGAGLAVVFPAWMKHVLHQDLNRFVQWAVRVWNVELDVYNPEAVALEGIARMEAFFTSLGVGTRYQKEHGIKTTVQQVLDALGAARVPAGKVYTAKDIAEDPHYRARDMLLTQETRDGYSVEVPGIVPKLSATPGTIRSSAPHLGDDTDAVLAEMGLNAEQIALLRSKGVVQ